MSLAALNIAEWTNIGLMAAGGVILLIAIVAVTARRRWEAAMACPPRGTTPLDLVHVSIVLLVFILAMALLEPLGQMLPTPSGMTSGQWIGGGGEPGLWAIFSNALAKVVASASICLLAAWVAQGGLMAFGLRTDRLGRDVLWGIGGFLAVWPVCFALANLMVVLTGKPPAHGVMNLLHAPHVPGWGAVILWLSAIIVSPVAEELFFRGLIQTVVRGYTGRAWLAILVASGLFGLIHYAQPQFVLALAALGVVLGYVYEHTGSLIGPILIHILFNGRTLVLDLLSGHQLPL